MKLFLNVHFNYLRIISRVQNVSCFSASWITIRVHCWGVGWVVTAVADGLMEGNIPYLLEWQATFLFHITILCPKSLHSVILGFSARSLYVQSFLPLYLTYTWNLIIGTFPQFLWMIFSLRSENTLWNSYHFTFLLVFKNWL